MAQLIDKADVVAEIKKRIKKYATIDVGDCKELEAIYGAKCKALMEILSFLDTLKPKEVELDREIEKEIETRWRGEYLFTTKFKESAKHFFELGLKAQK